MTNKQTAHLDDLTRLTQLGRDPSQHNGSVSPPVERTSTRVFSTLAELEAAHSTGRLSDFLGSNMSIWLEQAVSELEGSDCETIVTGTGMSALAIVLLTVLGQGDEVLMPESVFKPTRNIAENLLKRMGISVRYYDPVIGAGISKVIGPKTRLVLTESPGSNTFEVQDIPAIVKSCHAAGVLVAIDNSWATPLFFRPLEHGVDFSISAITKYLIGHSDVLLGTIAASKDQVAKLRATANQLGDGCSSDDIFLALRGMRTLGLRLRQHEASALQIAHWLAKRSNVIRVLHPALPSCPGNEIWKRDFDGSTGLFSVLFKPMSRRQLESLVEALKVFKPGYSWGGFESLILPIDPIGKNSVPHWTDEGTLVRFNVGLESANDLQNDLQQALDKISGDLV